MATKTITQYTDDLDGSEENVETVKFGLHGATYEIDLSKANQYKLTAALEPFLNVARKANGGSAPKRASSGSSARSASDGPAPKAVRQWAEEEGIHVPPRGRIPGSVIEQYNAAH